MRSAPWAAVWIVCPSASPPPLTDLRAANDALLGEMERERELERQRSAFSPLPPTS